ncbi:MAG: IS1182 family transposase [Betaproteobacteria bacterium]|nr:MAG: IS1182 family transposase [Betaproteobacteria bacterium]
MARYKVVDRSPSFLPIVLDAQLIAGSFEYALDYLIDHEIDLSELDRRYRNDETGAPAYDPAVMLKVVLLAYSRGVVSSRAIERLCRENVLFMAISGDSAPQFTTIAKFVRQLGEEVSAIFAQVLIICDRQGLIGRQMFAIDGVKLPSNADKRRSGTHAELAHEAERMERAVAKMMRAHRGRDEHADTDEEDKTNAVRIERLSIEAKRVRAFLAASSERRSEKGAIRKSNVTDNDSAKMATSKGVIQGYTAVAAVDGEAQIIVAAQVHGSGSEQCMLLPMVKKTERLRTDQTIITADAGYHSEANLQGLHDAGVPALIADGLMRRRDERFADQARYKALPDPLYDKAATIKASSGKFLPSDFAYDSATGICICPAGKKLYSTGSACSTHGRKHHKFQGAKRDCVPCHLREQCLRYPDRTQTRQVAFFDKNQGSPLRYTERMKRAIDSDRGRKLYGRRIAIVEPVFANLRHNKRLDRFTLRSQPKVNTQWNLYCLVHNIEKLAHHGYAG